LAASSRTVVISVEAGLKYFVLGSVASAILLLGIALLYGFTGATNFLDISLLSVDTLGLGAVVPLVLIFSL